MLYLFADTGADILSRFWPGVLVAIVYGLIAIALLLIGYWLFDRITPQVHVQKELCQGNMAVAIVVAALLLGIAYICAHVVQ
jgi:putative membrane protein